MAIYKDFGIDPPQFFSLSKLGFHSKIHENYLCIHSDHTVTMHIKIQAQSAPTDKQCVTKGKSIIRIIHLLII